MRHVRNRARGADNTGNQQPRNEVRHVRNRARGADNTGNQQPRNEAAGSGPHRAAVQIPRVRNVLGREEREARERRGERAMPGIRVPETRREREEARSAIEREEREAREQRGEGRVRVPPGRFGAIEKMEARAHERRGEGAMPRVRVPETPPREREEARSAIEREAREQRGEGRVRVPPGRFGAIEQMEARVHERRREGAMPRMRIREAEGVRNMVGREARDLREAAGVRRRVVPQEPYIYDPDEFDSDEFDPDDLDPELEQEIQREREMRANRRELTGHEMMILRDTDRQAWLKEVVMGNPMWAGVVENMARRQAASERQERRRGAGGQARNGCDDHQDEPVHHGHCACDHEDYAQQIKQYLDENYYQKILNRPLERNGDSPPSQLNDVSTLQGGSKQSGTLNFKTSSSKKSSFSTDSTPITAATSSKPAAEREGDVSSMKIKLEELEKKLQKEEESKQCVVCMDRLREMIIRPCNHYCVCQSCARRLPKCPLCNRRIGRAEKVYNV